MEDPEFLNEDRIHPQIGFFDDIKDLILCGICSATRLRLRIVIPCNATAVKIPYFARNASRVGNITIIIAHIAMLKEPHMRKSIQCSWT